MLGQTFERAGVPGDSRDRLRLHLVVQQRGRTGVVADLTGGHEEAQGATVRVGDGMELGVHAAFRASDQAAEIPLFTRRLDAVRCAFR